MTVIKHGSVTDAVIAVGIMLEVLIVGGYDAEYAVLIET